MWQKKVYLATYQSQKSTLFTAIMSYSNLQKTKLFISKKEGEYKVNFDGIPFCIDEERVLDCQYGCHY